MSTLEKTTLTVTGADTKDKPVETEAPKKGWKNVGLIGNGWEVPAISGALNISLDKDCDLDQLCTLLKNGARMSLIPRKKPDERYPLRTHVLTLRVYEE